MNFNRKKLYSVIQGSLSLGLAAGLVSTGWAQEEAEEESAELDKILVTGSRIKRVDVETANPVTIISREDIDMSGDASVAEVLRNMSTNTFGSWRGVSGYGSGAPGAVEIDLRGVGATLVLIDGRRMPGAGYDGGATQNLNNIPLAIVERIEVLRGGASAIYGSDAIGGVVNVITLKELDGASVSYRYDKRGIDDGENNQWEFSAGVTGERGNMLVTFQHTEYDELEDNAVSGFFNGVSWWGPVTNYDIYTTDGYFDTRWPTDICEQIPNTIDQGFRCGYAYSNVTWLYPRQQRDSIMSKFNYELTPNVTFNARLSFIGNETQSRFAPTPVSTNTIFMDADNPNAPADLPANALFLTLYHRTALLGTRDAFFTDNTFDTVFGLEGYMDAFNGLDWEINYQYTIKDEDVHNTNLVNDTLFQNGIDDGSFDIFNTAGRSAADWSEHAFQFYKTVAHTGIYEVRNERHIVDGNIGGELLYTDAFSLSAVVGGEFESTDFTQVSDPASASGIISGGSGGDDVFADRERTSLYAEVGFDLPGIGLELTGAVRYDEYDQNGITTVGIVNQSDNKTFDDTTWQFTAGWRPTDNLLLRGAVGTAFRAPAMNELFASRSFGFPSAYDYYYCDTLGNPDGDLAYCNFSSQPQILTFSGGNPTLDPENADTMTFGGVWQITDDLSMEVQYYDIEYTDRIESLSLNDILLLNNAAGGNTPAVTRQANGKIESIQAGLQNSAELNTSGVDIMARYGLGTDRAGNFTFDFQWTHVLDYERVTTDALTGDPISTDLLGDWGFPKDRATFQLGWSLGDFFGAWRTNYIAGQKRPGSSGVDLDAVMYNNAQLGFYLPWDGEITVGVNNIFEEEIQFYSGGQAWRGFDYFLYNPDGRSWWVKYEQNF